MKTIAMIKRLNNIRQIEPHIHISRYGQLSDSPGVDISIHSRNGLIGVYDFPYGDDKMPETTEAKATMYANDLSHITGLPIMDERARDPYWQPKKAQDEEAPL